VSPVAQEPLVAQYEFRSGALRGTQLALYSNRLAHQGVGYLEVMPLVHVAAVRIEYLRDSRKLGWAIILLVAAILLFVVSSPLQSWAGTAAAAIADQARAETPAGGVQTILRAVFRALEGLASLMPVAGAALCAGAAALGILYWQGRTTLTLTLAAVERAFPSPGRDRMLADFADMLGERLAQRVR